MLESSSAVPTKETQAIFRENLRGDVVIGDYTPGDSYRFEHVPARRVGEISYCNGVVTDHSVEVTPEYYRVWPAGVTQCEVCTPSAFRKHFQIIP